MKALVMGGNRFFGKTLVKRLLDEGVDVTLLNRGQHPDDFGSDLRRIVADRNHLEDLLALKKGSWDIVYDQICYDATQARAACRVFKDKTEHYVFTSTASVYKANEVGSVEDDFLAAHYEYSKVVATTEDYAEAKRQAEAVFVKEASFPLSLIRFPIVMGEDDYTQRLKFHVTHVQKNVPMSAPNLEAKMSYVHSDDAADFLAELLDCEALGAMNVASPQPLSLRELVSEIEKVLGKKAIFDSKGERSPYGIEQSRFINTSKLHAFGFQTMEMSQWLSDLIALSAD